MVGILGRRHLLVLQPLHNARAFNGICFVVPSGAAEPARVSDRPASRATLLDNRALRLDRGRMAGHRKAQQVGSFRRSHERVIDSDTADKHLNRRRGGDTGQTQRGTHQI